MPVVRVFVVPVVVPLVQVTVLSNGVRVQCRKWQQHDARSVARSKAIVGYLHHCLNGVDHQFTDDGQVSRRAIAGDAMVAFFREIFVLGRCGGGGYQFVRLLGVLGEPVQTELIGSPHQWVGHVVQVVLVLCEEVTLPQRVH